MTETKVIDQPLVIDETLLALAWAIRGHPAPDHVNAAAKAERDLWDRVLASDRPLTRDEQRLARRYQSIHDAFVADVIKAYRNR